MNGITPAQRTNIEPADLTQAEGRDFLGLFCEKFRCNPHKFKKRVFWECVPARGAQMARVLRLLNPGLFKTDFDLIEKIKHATSFDELKRMVDFHGAQNAPQGIIRLVLKVRVSKHRLLALAKRLFRPTA